MIRSFRPFNAPEGRKDQAYVDLGPFLRREVNRHKRPEAGLDVGDKKDEPVESAKAFRRRRQGRLRSPRLIKQRRAGLIGRPAAVISIVAVAA